METLNKQLIAVDLKKSTMIPLPQFIQNDTNILEIQVKDNGSDADFTNIGKIVVNYKRPDKVVISRLLDSSNNRVTYEIGLQEMEVAGHAEVELQFFSSDALQRISTKRFKVLMYESIGTDNIFEDSGDLTILQELFVEVEDLNNRMELAESARESAETTRVNAESARTAAESDRSTAEAGRVSAEQARITAETARQNQESTRQTNEDVRVSQENARNAAEQSRQTNTQNAIDNAVAATNNANQAADNANSIANTLIHRGEYDPLVTYVPRNVVSYFGSGYMNIAESTGIDPTNSTNWLMVSSKGDQGIQGIQGEPGPKGEPGTGNVNSVNGKYGPDIELNASDVGAISATEKGAPNGVPTLDENGKVPADQIDSSGYAPQTEFAQLQDDVTRHQAERATPTTLGHV
ncbi:BppU family phage baseplate upper protein, partial [Cytobacillus oceanisediminis]|uniref:BppU family phage baseplate upper protein n=1 Tax=Cytobacillus oceanisediminis TaxID=665099 RepID=UPI000AF40EF3